jgi:predicted DNA-binding transcriptional regulator YafY
MLSIPAPLAELGMGQELQSALLKLAAALPTARRGDEERVRQRIHLDPVGWAEANEPVPHLQTIQRAIWADHKLHLTYRLPFGAQAEWLVAPYGLVAKASAWYLVCARNGQVRVHRVSHLLAAYISDETFERPADFDLPAFWREWCAAVEVNRPQYPATVRVAPELVHFLPQHFGGSIRDAVVQAGPPDAAGWIKLTLPFEALEAARERLLSYGRAVEVLAPQALRDSVVDFARQIVALYDS